MYEYPFGNGQQLNLDWFLSEWKNLLAAWEAEKNGIEGALQAEIDRAEAALADVFTARDAAAQSAANALESKNAAAQSASDASGYLATVRADANAARDAAQNAAQSESNAADSAQTAVASKNAAGQSERNAAQSEANANSSKNAAAQSASDADASKSAAAQSAADADASKSAAAQSAEDASDAAASVEASAEQIATNASDIDLLENALKNYPTPLLPYYKYSKGTLGPITNNCGELVINGSRTGLYNITGETVSRVSDVPNLNPENCNIFIKANTVIKIDIACLEDSTMSGSGWFAYIDMYKKDTVQSMNLRGYLYANDTAVAKRAYTLNITEDNYYGLYLYMSSASGTAKYLITMNITTPSGQNMTTSMKLENTEKDNSYKAIKETE